MSAAAGSSLRPADPEFESLLRDELPDSCFREAEPKYLEEPRGLFKGVKGLVVAPDSADLVSKAVRKCAEARVGIVPYGGGTGLVGGQLLPEGPRPLILSLERMRRVRSVSAEDGVMIAEAGVPLQEAQEEAAKRGKLFPLSLASEGSCRIGGVLSTNAGGVQVLRFGNARDLCLGVEAVLPDGSIWKGLRKVKKDNAGYDLRHWLAGAEGTLGIITAASLRLFPAFAETAAAFAKIRDARAAAELYSHMQASAGEFLSAFELMQGTGLELLREQMPEVRLPFENLAEWMVLVDLGASMDIDLSGILESSLGKAMEEGLVTDCAVSRSEAQRMEFWKVRESIPEANRRTGAVSTHDISVPTGRIPEFIERAGNAIGKIGPLRINCFGHVGDGNLHYNVFPPRGEKREAWRHARHAVKDAVYDLVAEMEGSFSAEHGVGRLKRDELLRYRPRESIDAMRKLKAALDPLGIMNPGAILAPGEAGEKVRQASGEEG